LHSRFPKIFFPKINPISTKKRRKMVIAVSRTIIAILVTAYPARATSTPGLIAGYQSETNVDTYLLKDLIQRNFEMIMEDETCAALDAGKSYWLNNISPEIMGGYFRSLPTWGQFPGQGVSNEWNELREYYNDDDYQVLWVKKALNRKKTTYNPRGNADWGQGFGPEFLEGNSLEVGDGQCVGYEESVKKATAYTFAYIESVQLMEKAIDKVEDGCIYNNNQCPDALEAWDASVAIFAGSKEGNHGNNCQNGCYGYSLYALGDIMCPFFGTCGPTGINNSNKEETAYINNKMMQDYAAGRTATKNGCVQLMKAYQRFIGAKMLTPFVQGVLLHAYRLSDEGGVGTYSDYDKEVAMAATYGMTATAKLWAVSKRGAKKVEDQLQIGIGVAGTAAVNYTEIKLAFECNYRYLGLSCVEVGALPGGVMCDDTENGSSQDFNCGSPSDDRNKLCQDYTGNPGIIDILGRRRNRVSYFPDYPPTSSDCQSQSPTGNC
jgi:hypothetical protein